MNFFGKHRPHPLPSGSSHDTTSADPDKEEWFRIDYDMMIRGSNVLRHGKTIKQIGVTVNGSTRLVTSGELVDRQTYNALLAMNAIRPEGRIPHAPKEAPPPSRVLPVLDEDQEA